MSIVIEFMWFLTFVCHVDVFLFYFVISFILNYLFGDWGEKEMVGTREEGYATKDKTQ